MYIHTHTHIFKHNNIILFTKTSDPVKLLFEVSAVIRVFPATNTYNSQSTARILVTSSGSMPIAVSTIIIVTRPACGTLAAPIDAKVAVKLKSNKIGRTTEILARRDKK